MTCNIQLCELLKEGVLIMHAHGIPVHASRSGAWYVHRILVNVWQSAGGAGRERSHQLAQEVHVPSLRVPVRDPALWGRHRRRCRHRRRLRVRDGRRRPCAILLPRARWHCVLTVQR
jgi:hypothetical protein